jgi:catechol 2,3-dioxygenase-like lactoylglutathione lyase family enzyme
MPWSLGTVGHFGIAVRDPKKSARWWTKNFGLKRAFAFEDGVAVENDAITIVLHRGTRRPSTIGHMSFHLRSMRALREALADLRKRGVKLEDPGDEIGPEVPGSPHFGLWFHDPDGYRWELSVQNALKRRRRP